MLWLDWLIVAIVGYGLVTGWWNGLVRTLLNVVALGAAFILTPVVRPFAHGLVELVVQGSPLLQGWFASVVSFLLIYVGLSVIGLVWTRFLAKGAIRQTDKVVGMLVGGALSLLVVVVPLALILAVPVLAKAPAVQQTFASSKLIPYLLPMAPALQNVANSWLHPTAPGQRQPKAPAAPQQKPPKPGANKRA